MITKDTEPSLCTKRKVDKYDIKNYARAGQEQFDYSGYV